MKYKQQKCMNNKRNKKNIWRKYGPGKGWGRGTHFLSIGRDVPAKLVLFSECVWIGDGGVPLLKVWEGIHIPV